ncbi:hypothetical protein PAXRUDRAFT_164842, partial [Paxillus rubicundulus Ve08.2h10]
LTLNVAGTPLISFSSACLLVVAVHNGLIAHSNAYMKAGILHHDMSPENVMIHVHKGLLIDWNLVKLVTASGCRQMTHGTFRC